MGLHEAGIKGVANRLRVIDLGDSTLEDIQQADAGIVGFGQDLAYLERHQGVIVKGVGNLIEAYQVSLPEAFGAIVASAPGLQCHPELFAGRIAIQAQDLVVAVDPLVRLAIEISQCLGVFAPVGLTQAQPQGCFGAPFGGLPHMQTKRA